MPRFKYCKTGLDPDVTAKASGREMDISPKHAREICKAIKGLYIEHAITYLENVVEKKRSVPFKRYNRKVGHRSDLQGWHTGRYPVKASSKILEVLHNLENNIEYKGLEMDRCRIIHSASHRGRKIKRMFTRAFGKSSPKNNTLTHVEFVVHEV
jgi:large subunit ribosomal protein L22